MGQQRGILTPEERSRVMQLQDLLIARFVEQREAVAEGQEERVKTVEAEINSLLREGLIPLRPGAQNVVGRQGKFVIEQITNILA